MIIREYEKAGNLSLAKSTLADSSSFFFGKTELHIEYSDYHIDVESPQRVPSQPAHLIANNDRFRQVPHRPLQPPALIPQTRVRFFLGNVLALLQDAIQHCASRRLSNQPEGQCHIARMALESV
jgi:hypothetical protein